MKYADHIKQWCRLWVPRFGTPSRAPAEGHNLGTARLGSPKSNHGTRIGCTLFSTICVAVIASVAGCHSTSSNNTQTVSGTFISGNNRIMQFRLNNPGTLSSEKIMPVDPNAVITIDGKTSTMSKLAIGQSISVTQNLDTKRVVEVDAK